MSSTHLVPGADSAKTSRIAKFGAPGTPAMPATKRLLDLMVTSIALTLVSPLIIASAVFIKLSSPGPILFRQTRVGRGEKPFQMLKLRTMYVDGDDSAHREFNRRELLGLDGPETSDGIFKLEYDPRITWIGRFLRRFSIDELPQLVNVMKGEMSLVGPRPSLPWEVELFTVEQRRRHLCTPGITGLWQISGRNALSMVEMLKLDVEYLERRSLLMDLRILLRTPQAVLFDRGAR